MPDRPRRPNPSTTLPDAGRALLEFLKTEGGGGVVLLVASAVALAWANSPWQDGYQDLWHHEIAIGPAGWALKDSLQHWINDALMAVFFFVVGLEIKRELVRGELQERRTAALPVIAAVGGMVAPATLFWALAGSGEAARGWGIPMATDIAFAVGVLALLGRHAPRGLKIFLLTLAIVDDIGAILVIALFYTADFGADWLLGAVGSLAVVVAVRQFGVKRPVAYIPLAVVVWYCTYRSGIHPTIAAVALGLLTPAGAVGGRPVLEQLEHRLHPWSSYFVIPIFALANAGVALSGDAIEEAAGSRLTWAVIVGLVAGKLIGIAGATFIAARARLGQLPAEVGNVHIIGAGAVGGIGFTVSLFITGLAFTSETLQAQAKIGILIGSLTAAMLGAAILRRATSSP